MLSDREGLDWRLMMYSDLFIEFEDDEDQDRDIESMEEDPNLTFKVAELTLLGLLYCKCDHKTRV